METSPAMRTAQEATLGPLAETHGWSLTWHDSIEQIPYDAGMFTLLLAHEFFDALPFHLIQVRLLPYRYLTLLKIFVPAENRSGLARAPHNFRTRSSGANDYQNCRKAVVRPPIRRPLHSLGKPLSIYPVGSNANLDHTWSIISTLRHTSHRFTLGSLSNRVQDCPTNWRTTV